MNKKEKKNKKEQMKINIIVVTTIVIIFCVSYFIFEKYSESKNKEKNLFIDETKYIEEIELEAASEVNVTSKIDELKRKLATKGLVEEGDLNLENHEYATALKKYLQIYKDFPRDKEISNKIGDTFYELKNYNLAYKYYNKAIGYENFDKYKVLNTLLNSKDLKNLQNRQYMLKELTTYDLTDEEKFYYAISLRCVENFDLCKTELNEYFSKVDKNEITFDKLLVLKEAIDNFNNFQTEDKTYLEALLSGAFFKNETYPVSILMGKKILSEKPGYGSIIRIIAKSYYELGKYNEAKNYLVEYNEKYKNEVDIIYSLGVTYEKLKKYVISTVHFKKALNLGHQPSLELRRRLIYNYNEIGNTEKVLESFDKLIKEESEGITDTDLSLAIYHNIVHEKYDKALEYINIAISNKAYENEGKFYGYKGWITIERDNDLEKAEAELKKGLDLDEKNPMINLLLGTLYIKDGQEKKSIVYLKRAISLDKSGSFSTIAERELESVQNKLRENYDK